MAGKESENYRPRRMWSNDAEPAETSPRPSDPLAPGDAGGPGQPDVAIPAEDTAASEKPDVEKPAADKPATTTPSAGKSSEKSKTSGTPAKGGPSEVDESTAILPRTSRRTGGEELDETPPRTRNRTALLVGAVVAVAVLGLAIGYAIFAFNKTSSADPAPPVPSTSSSGASSGASTPPAAPGALLTDDSMLNANDAKSLDGDRTWKVALTQTGLDAESPQAACLAGEPAEGQPTPQQTIIRLLSSSGKDAPGVLHQADAYATPEEAAQAYVLTAKALGGCAMDQTYINSGQVVTGLGDQSLALVLAVKDGSATEWRSVMLARTGRVVDIVDVASKGDIISQNDVAKAFSSVVKAQCTTSGGKCADGAKAVFGPPPVGGDQLGFLATADLPPAGSSASTWIGNTPADPEADKTYSGCETVDFAKTEAKTAKTRTYLLEDNAGLFGLDEVVLTMDDATAAEKMVADIKGDLDSCKTRKLTASVTSPKQIEGTGARGSKIAGWTATVTQSTSSNEKSTYRVGIASVGAKVVYTYLSADLKQKLDLTDAEFDIVTTRAAQRATQVS